MDAVPWGVVPPGVEIEADVPGHGVGNLVKWRSERRPYRTSPAMRVGLTDECWTWRRVLAQRLFPAREPVGCNKLRTTMLRDSYSARR